MKLSDQERRWLMRWERREKQWLPVTRWVCIACGLVTVGLAYWLIHEAEKTREDFLGVFALLLLLMAGAWFGAAFSKWAGDVKLRLFLRLIRDHEDKEP